MSALQAILYGVVQGLTEFLPISSSAHLTLLPWLMDWQDPGLSFDVALHLGTLFALLAYFWKEWWALAKNTLANRHSSEARLLMAIALATLPAALAGLLLNEYARTLFRNPVLMAGMLMLFALALGWAERRGKKNMDIPALSYAGAMRIGMAQALSIVPGVSRSGVTITAGLLEGLKAEDSARFSFLLSTPIVFGAALHELPRLGQAAYDSTLWLAIASSAISGALAIHLLLMFARSSGFLPFVIYRFVLGTLILGIYFYK